jgi:uncharacterized protein (DUF1800 family)
MDKRRIDSRAIAALVAIILLQAPPSTVANTASQNAAPSKKSAALTPAQRATHALNRLTFGPRPGDVARVQAMGVDKWIESQLHPEKIDDSQLQTLLLQLPAMQLSEARLIQKFPPNPAVRQMERAGTRLPSDEIERAIYANAVANIQAQQEKKAAIQPVDVAAAGKPMAITQSATAVDSSALADAASANRILTLKTPQQRFKALLALPVGDPRHVLQAMKPADKQHLVEGMTPEQKEAVIALADINRVVAGEAMEQKVLYDIYSNRQLLEVMTDFWLNHFNIYLRKSGIAPWQIATYERDVIRPHALGNFEELLDAVATSPAMMTYLDNAESIGPDSPAVQNAARKSPAAGLAKTAAKRGLNENYARELMELHTLGVNGGYTQRDVTEVAKVFTGWTVDAPKDGGGFSYNDRRHEPGTKTVLGKTITQGGQQEGFEVLHILAASPAAAHFISQKLAIRFVSDSPPPALVKRMTKKYLASHGDIRQVLHEMFRSQEFWSPNNYSAKVKTPLEFVASSIRATNSNATQPQSLIAALNQMGMPLYGMQPPTGYPTTADKWVSSEQLINRMNFALGLAANRLPGIRCDLSAQNTDIDAEKNEIRLEKLLLNGDVSAKTHSAVLAEMTAMTTQQNGANARLNSPAAAKPLDPLAVNISRKNGQAKPMDFTRNLADSTNAQTTVAAGLLLGSPDFQRH